MTPRFRLLVRVALVLAVVFAADFLWRTLGSQEAKPVVKRTAEVTAARPAAQPPARTPQAAAPVQPASTPASVGPWRTPAPIASYAPVFDAPLFLPSRSVTPPPPPPEETVEPEYAAPDPMNSAQLIGVAGGDGSDIALVNVDGAVQRFEPGDVLGEWVLVEIGPNRAVFVKNEEQRELVIPGR